MNPVHQPFEAPGDREPRPHLRAVGIICDRCGHEASPSEARLAAWHVSRDGDQVVCDSCVVVDADKLDDLLLVWPACGHFQEGAVLYDRPYCAICDG
jgi:hypothetical protein